MACTKHPRHTPPVARSQHAGARFRPEPVVALKTLSLLLMAAFGPNSLALPTQGSVVAGTAQIASPTPQSVVITQSSSKAILQWNSFNVGSSESVRFIQPDAGSVTLNRVLGTDPSSILGRIDANGQVFLVNPNGVLFGRGASINTNGLVASTLDVSTNDFLQSRYRFSGNSLAEVVNQGELRSDGGGYVALLGNAVRNQGTISAQGGTVALAAGSSVTLDVSGDGLLQARVDRASLNALVENAGTLQADGGTVQLSARAQDAILRTVVNNTGLVQANSIGRRNGRIVLDGGDVGEVATSGTLLTQGPSAEAVGGTITVTGDKIHLEPTALLDATGSQGGGAIYVGGGWQGQDPAIRSSTAVYVAPGARLDASAVQQGNGGTVVVWSDIDNPQSSTRVHGALSARGGVSGGDGGRIETSGHWLDVAGIQVRANAPLGAAGVWLLDPEDLTVGAVATDAGTVLGPPTTIYTSGAGTPNVLNTDIEGQLNAGTNVVLQTAPTGAGAGNITVTSSIAKTAGPDATLTFNAIGGITINNGIGITSSSNRLHLNLGSGGTIAFAGANTLTTNGGDIAMSAQLVTGIPNLTGTGVENLNLNIAGPASIGVGAGAGAMTLPSGFATGFASVNVLAGTGDITFGGAVTFTDNMTFVTQGNIVINAASTVTTSVIAGDLILAGTNFLNSGGAGAVTTPGVGSRWIAYSTDPALNTFGGLLSGNKAIWGQTPGSLPPFAVPAGNHYVFATPGLVTATTSGSFSKTYGQAADLTGAISYSGIPLTSAATYGNVYQDLLVTDALAALPVAASAGDPATAAVTGSPYTIAPTGGTTNPGYSLNLAGGGTLTVQPAALNVSAQAISQPYTGQPFAGGNALYSGFVNGETAAALGGTLAFGGSSQGAVNAGQYNITPSGLSSSNYTITYSSGTLTIGKATLAVTAGNASKVYDGQPFNGGTASYTGFVNGDTPAVLGGTLQFGGTSQGVRNSGSYTILPFGLTSTNYTIAFNPGTLTVLPKTVSITGLVAADKEFDGTNSANILNWGTVSTGVGTETLVLQRGTAQFSDPTVGVGKPVTASGYTLADGTQGGLAANYTLQSTTAKTTASIYPTGGRTALQGTLSTLSQIFPPETPVNRAPQLNLDASQLGFTSNQGLRGYGSGRGDTAAGRSTGSNSVNANLLLQGRQIVAANRTPPGTPGNTTPGRGNLNASAGAAAVTALGATGSAGTTASTRLSSTGFSGTRPSGGAAGTRPVGTGAPNLPKDAYLKGAMRASVIGDTTRGAAIVASIGASGQTTRLITTVAPGDGFNIRIPPDVLGTSAGRSGATTAVATTGGRALPAWLQFDKRSLQLKAGSVPKEALPMTVRITGTSGAAVEVVLQ